MNDLCVCAHRIEDPAYSKEGGAMPKIPLSKAQELARANNTAMFHNARGVATHGLVVPGAVVGNVQALGGKEGAVWTEAANDGSWASTHYRVPVPTGRLLMLFR